jgi:hypothetical protein
MAVEEVARALPLAYAVVFIRCPKILIVDLYRTRNSDGWKTGMSGLALPGAAPSRPGRQTIRGHLCLVYLHGRRIRNGKECEFRQGCWTVPFPPNRVSLK